MAITGKKPSEWSAATITAVKEVLSLNSANYITVDVGVDAKANGAALIAAYTAAKALTPNGAALATDNRACVIIPPANYDLDHGTENACVPLVLDTEFVDIIGLTTDAFSQFIYGTPDITTTGIIMQTADDVHISNIKAKCDITQELFLSIIMEGGTPNLANIVYVPSSYFPATDLSKSVVDNCIFQEGSATLDMGGGVVTPIGCSMRIGVLEYSGTFTSCTGGYGAFGSYGTASGTFTNCTGGDWSFGGNGTASGTFNNCTGGAYSFGGGNGTASGTFNNCTGGDRAFGGGNGTASGTFNNCTGGDRAFGYNGIASGTFSFCKLTDAFGTLKCTVATVEIAAGGTNYEVDDELTVVGGTGTAATLKVTTVDSGVITGIQVLTVGAYTALPENPVSTTGHTEDATFNLTWNEGHIYGCVDSTGFIAEKNWDDI